MEFEKEILNKIIDKYERSKVSKIESAKHKKINLSLADAIFNGKRNGSQELDDALNRIGKLGFCKINFANDYFSSIELIVESENISQVYRYLQRSNPKERKEKLIEYLLNTNYTSNIYINMRNAFMSKIKNGEFNKVENYFKNFDELRDVCKALEEMSFLKTEVPERIFSVQVFSDSKKISNIQGTLTRIIKEFSEVPFDDEDDVIASFGVVKNKTYAFIKGPITIKINNQVVDLAKYNHELALSDEMISEMEIIDIKAETLMTIENLTSFNVTNLQDTIIIYLGGFHNCVRRRLIQKIYLAKSNINALHFGDIDAGGFYILKHLREKTEIDFKPYHMSILELQKYEKVAKKLTENDEARIKKMLLDKKFADFYNTLNYMLRKGIKLEQEAE